MATTTPLQGIPVPQAADADNVPYDLDQALRVVEKRLVMTFASAAARDSAISAPTEGMHVYLIDVDKEFFYTGSGWRELLTTASPIPQTQVTGLGTSLDGKAATSHTHPYAAAASNARFQASSGGIQDDPGNNQVFFASGLSFRDTFAWAAYTVDGFANRIPVPYWPKAISPSNGLFYWAPGQISVGTLVYVSVTDYP